MRFKHDVTNIVYDVLTSTLLCKHMTLLQRRLEQYFKNVSCFCNFDVYGSNRKAMNRNWSNQKANPALKTKAGNK